MIERKTLLTSFLLVLLAVTIVSARHVIERGPVRPRRDPAGQRALFAHDANNIRMTMSNWGEYGNPDQNEGYLGFEFPKGSETDFLFSAGIWVGAMVDDTPLVSTGTDGDNGTNEFAPSRDNFVYQSNLLDEEPYHFSLIALDDDGDWDAENDDLDENGEPSIDWDGPDEDANGDGIFYYDPEPHIDEDPPGNIADDLIDNDHDGDVDGDDDNDGDADPDSDDDDGDGEADEDGAAMAAQHITAFYDDCDPDEVGSPDNDGHTPLNIRIEQRSYSWNIQDNAVMDAVLFEATIRNIGEETLSDVYIGLFADPDVAARGERGDPASIDDWTLFDEDNLMAVMGDDTTDQDGYDPGIFAIKIIRTPRPLDELDLSYRNFNREGGGDPDLNRDKYEMISSGEIDDPSRDLSDWRFLIGFGPNEDDDPWELEPQETLEIAYVFIGAEDRATLEETAEALQQFYDEGREDILRGDYVPIPARPAVTDVGDGESLMVTWRNYTQLPRVDGMNLHYGDLDEVEEVIDVGEDNDVVVSDLTEEVSYYFVIGIYDDEGEEVSTSDTTWMTPLSTPRKPIELQIAEEGYHSIELSWLPNPHLELDIAGYNLYRSMDDGEYGQVNGDPIAELTYPDEMNEFGLYTYRLTAVDEDGNESEPYGVDSLDTPAVGAPYVLEEGKMLLVDETRNGNGRPGSPNDQQSDDFYHSMLERAGIEIYDELDYTDFYSENEHPLTAYDVGEYETVIWHGDDKSVLQLGDNFNYPLSQIITFGGKMLISGWDILGNFTPFDTVEFPEDNIVRRSLHIAGGHRSIVRNTIEGLNGAEGQNGYPSLEIDREKISDRWAGLDRCWVLEPDDGGEVIYTYISSNDDSPFNDQPCAIRYSDEDRNTIVLGFPLYFMRDDQAAQFMERALNDLGVGISETDEELHPSEFRLWANYPNPFNSQTMIRYSLPKQDFVTLQLFDISGRQVTTLFNGHQRAGLQTTILNGEKLPSGLYFVRLSNDHQLSTQKVMLIK